MRSGQFTGIIRTTPHQELPAPGLAPGNVHAYAPAPQQGDAQTLLSDSKPPPTQLFLQHSLQ